MSKRFAAGLASLALVAASGCEVREPPPAAAPDAGAGMVRAPVEAGAHDVPVRPTLDASPTDLARFAEEALVEAGVRGWALAVIHEGQPVERRFSAGVGGSVRTVDAGTMFDLQSVAKPVIAWGVMNLVEAGRVDLDQPIERYLSRWRLPPSDFDHREVTVRRVLSHTAGLSWGRRQQFAAEEVLPPIEEVLSGTDAEGRRLEVIVEPGTRFIYSSGGYTLLQLLIEEVSGRPFAELMEDEVLRPLGMHHSVFSPALPEAPVIGKMDALGRVAETDRVATASSLITDLEELTAFALAHFEAGPVGSRGRGVLRPASVDSMMAPVLAARSRRGLGYVVRRLDGDLLVAGHSGGGGDFRVVPETGDGLVILTNSTVGYFPIERIQCVWTSWLTGTDEGCPVPSSYALLGAYGRGGVAGALDYYEDLVDRADPDYLVGIEQLSDFARLFVGAGMDADAAGVYRYMSRSGTPEGAVYGEAADGLLSGHRVPEDRLPCYLGEYRSSSGDTIRLERAAAGVTVTIDPVAGIGGPVRILTDRVFLFDFSGFIGELVFDLAESGAAMRVMVRESAFGISLTAERSPVEATEAAGCAVMQSPPAAASDAGARVVRVAPPTGERETDRASILTALEQVEPGGTIQFAPGTYLLGETMRIATPRITVLGHARGTVLRGCDPDEQEVVERRAVRALASRDQNIYQAMRRRCGLLELTGGNVTVRGLTFEHARRGLVLGCCEGEEVSDDGGYLIEGNTFRNSANGIRASLVSAEPTVIRDNRFVNVFHALSAGISHVHMLDNDISVPEPLRVPGTGHPGFAIGIRPPPPGPADGPGMGAPVCEQNVIAGNRIEGHTDGILLRAFETGTSCRDNTIRNNVIQVRRVRFPVPWLYAGLLPLTNEADTTFVGVPLGLLNSAARTESRDAGSGAVENNTIEGNRVVGAHGIGIQVLNASRNRIVDNTLAGIRPRDPFPGNITTGSQEWSEANGSGIWISPGSDGNEIVGNTFEEVETAAVFLEGDSNRVTLRGAADSVRDLGTGNEVSVADGAEGSDASEERVAGAADTVHVAPPTGEQEADRASILAALDAVEPGGTILFSPARYLVGEIIHVTVPGITVLGHSEGTTLRGCDPTMFPRDVGLEEMFVAAAGCNGLDMAGGHQPVRGLTFEYAWHALVLGGMECMEGRGCVPVLEPVDIRGGGYLVEGNTFRASANGVRAIGQWRDPAVIRDNDFVDTFHAAVVHGSTVHVMDNDISAPDPARVPSWGYPGGALLLSSTDLDLELSLHCAGNIFARNRVERHPTAIGIAILRSGSVCRDNVIRDNTIRVTRVRTEPTARGETASTDEEAWRFGVPISLVGSPEAFGLEPGSAEEAGGTGGLEGNLIEGNRILGAEGLGVEIFQASRNRIVGNTIRDVRRRDPFPGASVNAPDPERSGWREANGSGIWVSPGSDENEIVGNTFEDVAGAAVVLEGDSNRVETRSATDSVRDLGTGNRVSGPSGSADAAARGGHPVVIGQRYAVTSNILGEERPVFVHTPPDYAASSARYPVLYLLDAGEDTEAGRNFHVASASCGFSPPAAASPR